MSKIICKPKTFKANLSVCLNAIKYFVLILLSSRHLVARSVSRVLREIRALAFTINKETFPRKCHLTKVPHKEKAFKKHKSGIFNWYDV